MENAPTPRQFYEGIGIPKGYEHHVVVAAVCASSRTMPRVTGAAKAAAGDDPSSPINGGSPSRLPESPFSS